jgi:hypothetical protein
MASELFLNQFSIGITFIVQGVAYELPSWDSYALSELESLPGRITFKRIRVQRRPIGRGWASW